ncbi:MULTISPECIES: dual specificity protein phosphatase family protein [Pseudomonas]|jgi:protein tyrosine/serine phosphatase|uniref:Protein tyrosine phosphatase n=1 Tax=Pseudomonas orientalis TaxID=76758 RepID=A0A4Q7D3S4_9PSED|nr:MULTISPECIES: dual specificity protein phosphatase family protein [Pseudomonas]POM12373.1 protein tyrosine phosphatase [Pseudomonas sp. WP001]MBY8928965.1 dual specificity protein phosphatase family protein [Pseudomonas sp. Wu6]RZI31009.1 protein tyrosine phosphatase [Pseudomonas orientalis]CRM75479.1 Protein tyrosine/serine phosphatase [Pseudomonas sp. 44 R 15]CRN01610.1 Protein tyrosine/serine phosphatase [Pseudomonas sp. 34 E 7]
MFKIRLLPAFGLALMALITAVNVHADSTTSSIRSPEWAQPVGDQYNLHQMTPTLYRSALPDSDAVPVLEKLKIGTVINFLPESDSAWLKSADIKQVQIIYRTNHVDDSDVLAALRAIQEAQANGSVLMHCKHGSDRTGLMAAMYRVVIQGWSKEDALNEMTLGGYGSSNGFKDGVRYMMKADIDKLRTALANGDCSTSAFALCSMKDWITTTGKEEKEL